MAGLAPEHLHQFRSVSDLITQLQRTNHYPLLFGGSRTSGQIQGHAQGHLQVQFLLIALHAIGQALQQIERPGEVTDRL